MLQIIQLTTRQLTPDAVSRDESQLGTVFEEHVPTRLRRIDPDAVCERSRRRLSVDAFAFHIFMRAVCVVWVVASRSD